MSCYSCGSPAGSRFQMCRPCVNHHKADHERRFKAAVKEGAAPAIGDGDAQSWQLLRTSALSIIVFIGFYLFGPHSNEGALSASLYAGMAFCWCFCGMPCLHKHQQNAMPAKRLAFCWCFCGLTWFIFWSRTLACSALWAAASFLCPVLVYRCVFSSWKEASEVFYVHFCFLITGLALAFYLPGETYPL
ncbi:MAG: hypothetical protein J5J00_05225 [Deltaproteobacteria bacterium]|nr:hypothetical protein [Deltaproteobacteria bacterium]